MATGILARPSTALSRSAMGRSSLILGGGWIGLLLKDEIEVSSLGRERGRYPRRYPQWSERVSRSS